MIKLKHRLNIDIIKPIIDSLPNNCNRCKFYDKEYKFCILLGEDITCNICKKLSYETLSSISRRVHVEKDNKCGFLCKYTDYSICELFEIYTHGKRCQQCIDLCKESYI